jgi:hypothetical protein
MVKLASPAVDEASQKLISVKNEIKNDNKQLTSKVSFW